MTLKCVALPTSIADAIIFLGLSGLYGYKLYLNSKSEVPVNEDIRKELSEVKSVITAMSIKPVSSKPPINNRMF
jgi:hypothetical protein